MILSSQELFVVATIIGRLLKFSSNYNFVLNIITDRYFYKHMHMFGKVLTENEIKNLCENIRFIEWNPETYSKYITESDIAVIPIDQKNNVALGKPENKMGWKGSDTRTVYFDNLEIPASNILGSPDKGFKHFLQTLTGGRITISALALGISQAAYNIALKYSQEREAFGKKINKFQSVSFKLADMATQIEAAKHLVYYAARLKDINKNFIKEAAMAKLFSSELAMRVTTDAIQLLGGYGYIREYNVERFFRDAKILEIGEGTSEIQRIIISREILKSL